MDKRQDDWGTAAKCFFVADNLLLIAEAHENAFCESRRGFRRFARQLEDRRRDSTELVALAGLGMNWC